MDEENYCWEGTTLLVLCQKHENKGKNWESAVKDAGKDSGWLLKRVIINDLRLVETKTEELIRKYKWIRKE